MNEKNNRLLIVEDDPGLQGQLRWSFDGFEIAVASERETALAEVRRFEPGVVTLDLGLPPDPGGTSEGFHTLE
jgi:two-component system NtrC family response regulator